MDDDVEAGFSSIESARCRFPEAVDADAPFKSDSVEGSCLTACSTSSSLPSTSEYRSSCKKHYRSSTRQYNELSLPPLPFSPTPLDQDARIAMRLERKGQTHTVQVELVVIHAVIQKIVLARGMGSCTRTKDEPTRVGLKLHV